MVGLRPNSGVERAAEDDEAGLPAARQVGAVVVGDVVLEEAAAEAGGLALVEEGEVLDEVGHARERAAGETRRDLLARALVLLVHDGVDGGVDLLGPRDGGLQHLGGADLAFGDQRGQGGGVVLAVFVETHGIFLAWVSDPGLRRGRLSGSDTVTPTTVAPWCQTRRV